MGSGFLSGWVRSLTSGIITMVRASSTPGMRLSAFETSPPMASMNMARSSVWVGIMPLFFLKIARPSARGLGSDASLRSCAAAATSCLGTVMM